MSEPASELIEQDIPASQLRLVPQHAARSRTPADADAPDPAEEIIRRGEDVLDELDDQLLNLLALRIVKARQYRSSRMTAGLPAAETSRDNAMIRRYAALLGRSGGEIGQTLVLLSRPPVVPEETEQ